MATNNTTPIESLNQAEHKAERTARFGVVFMRTLREKRGEIIGWGAGYSTLVVLAVVLYPVVLANNVLFNLLANLGVLAQFATNYQVDAAAITGFKGYLDFQVMGWGPLILALYTVPNAVSLVLEEEKRGTLDLLLSTPIPRWQLLIEKALALLVSVVVILVIVWTTLTAASIIVPNTDLTALEAAVGLWHLLPISSAIIAIGTLCSVIFRESRTATAVTAMVVLMSFFLRVVADSTRAPELVRLAKLSIFNYFSEITVLTYGPQPEWDALLFAVAAITFVLALVVFQRRELRR
jgi:ABC-2 type transport system permease protein